jgi:hypothetical protein
MVVAVIDITGRKRTDPARISASADTGQDTLRIKSSYSRGPLSLILMNRDSCKSLNFPQAGGSGVRVLGHEKIDRSPG